MTLEQNKTIESRCQANRNIQSVGMFLSSFCSDLGPMWLSEIDNGETGIKNHEHETLIPYTQICFFYYLFGFMPDNFFFWGRNERERERFEKLRLQIIISGTRHDAETHFTWDVGFVTSPDPTANTFSVAFSIILTLITR